MSLKSNITANYASQLYMAVVNMAMVPLCVRYMGVEAYGLVGFYALLQAWFQLLDLGLTPTLVRETARFRGGSTDALSLRRLFHVLEWIFIGLGLAGGGAMLLGSKFIALHWLKANQVPFVEVHRAIMLMAGITAFRWIAGIYRGAIIGFERLVWLSFFNITIWTLRFVAILPIFWVIGVTPTIFFNYQLVVAAIELGVLVIQTYRLLPPMPKGILPPWEWSPLRSVVRFSMSVAFTGSVWVIVTQTDKLVLSKILNLKDYAYFTLAVLAANGIFALFSPLTMAILPRLTRLAAEGDEEGLIRIYRQSTQLVTVICIPAALVLALWSSNVLWAWTGNMEITHRVAPVLTLYALGNGALILGAFPYYLQFAKGDLRLHVIGNSLFLGCLIPLLIFTTLHFGAVGAGWAWVSTNLVALFLWVPVVHRKFVPGLHAQWLMEDIAPSVLLPLAAGALLFLAWRGWPDHRWMVALRIGVIGLAMLLLAAAGSAWARDFARSRIGQRNFL